MSNQVRYFIQRPSVTLLDFLLESPGTGLVPEGSGLLFPQTNFADGELPSIPPAAPAVSSVVFTDMQGDTKVGTAGTPVSVVITFSEPVTVEGQPRFNFRIGSSGAIFYAEGIATAAYAAPSFTLTLKAILPSGVTAADNGNIELFGITLDPLRDRITGSNSGLIHANGALPETVTDSSYLVDNSAPVAAPNIVLGHGVSGVANFAEATASSGVVQVTGDSGVQMLVTFTDSATPTAHQIIKTVIGTGTAQAIQLATSELGHGDHQLQDGRITVTATATDPAGHASSVGSSSFVLDATAPTLSAEADGTPALSVMGKTLTLHFNETLDSSTVPLFNDPRAVQVSYTPLGGLPTNTTIHTLSLHGKQLQFYLDDAIPSGALVQFRYTDNNGTDDPNSVIQDLAGNDAASFWQPVANLSTPRPTVVGVSFGDLQGDWFNGKPGGTVEATIRFSESVSITGPVEFVFQVGDGPAFSGTFTPPPDFGGRTSLNFSFTLPDAPVDENSHIQLIGIGSKTAHNILGDYTHTQLLSSDFSSPLTDTGYWVDSTAPEQPEIGLDTDLADGASHAETTGSTTVLMVSAEADSSVLLTFTDHLGHGFSKTLHATGTEQPVTLTAADFGTGTAQLADGDIRVSAIATDLADNSSVAASSSFVLHPTPRTAFVPGESSNPALVFSNDTGTQGDFITSNRSQTITAHLGISLTEGEHLWGTVNAEAETPIWVNLDRFTHGDTVTWTDVTLAEATIQTHTLKLEVRDVTGNAGTLLMQDYTII